MKKFRILILEDDLETLAALLKKLAVLERRDYKFSFPVTVLSEYTQVEEYVNKKEDKDFDLILLDRDCKAFGSFHVLDFEKFNVDKIISISSMPEYNEDARQKGVTKIIHKDYTKLEEFSDEVVREIEGMIES
jgi:CheY-like chemotaxis protein